MTREIKNVEDLAADELRLIREAKGDTDVALTELKAFLESLAEPGPGEREELERIAKAALASGRVSVHDALVGWQNGWIDDARAMQLTGADSVEQLHEICRSSDIEVKR